MDFSEKLNILQSQWPRANASSSSGCAGGSRFPGGDEDAGWPRRIEFDHIWFAYRDVPPTVATLIRANGSELAKSGSGKHCPEPIG